MYYLFKDHLIACSTYSLYICFLFPESLICIISFLLISLAVICYFFLISWEVCLTNFVFRFFFIMYRFKTRPEAPVFFVKILAFFLVFFIDMIFNPFCECKWVKHTRTMNHVVENERALLKEALEIEIEWETVIKKGRLLLFLQRKVGLITL